MNNSVRKLDEAISNVTEIIISGGHASKHNSKQIKQSIRDCPVRQNLIKRRAKAMEANND